MAGIDDGRKNPPSGGNTPPRGGELPATPFDIDPSIFQQDLSTSAYAHNQIQYPPTHLPPGIPSTFQPTAEKLSSHVIHKIESLKPRRRLANREVTVLALEGAGSLRPGFLGAERAYFEKQWNDWFGPENWSMEHMFGTLRMPQQAALALYENAYVAFFKKNPDISAFITQNYRDVYDNSITNVQSGLDYNRQEVRDTRGIHLQDIAIRRALKKLELNFNPEAEALLQVRGARSNGWYLSPGVIPFNHDVTYSPISSWCDKGSIEEFYQSTRFCFVKGFGEHSSHSLWQLHDNNPSVVEDRIAARFLLRMLPSLEAKKVSLNDIQSLPWKLDSQSLPIDKGDIPAHRPFSPEEQYSILKKTVSILSFLSDKEDWTGTNARRDYSGEPSQFQALAPLARTHRNVKKFREVARKLSFGLEVSEKELEAFPEFQHLSGWTKHLHRVAERIKQHEGGVVFLARDALVLLEYMQYRDMIAGRSGDYSVAYMPGTTAKNSGTSRRRPEKALEQLVTDIASIHERVRTSASTEQDPKMREKLFSQQIHAYLQHKCSPESLEICEGIYRQATEDLKSWPQPLLIVDSDGTGKTTLFVKAVIEYFGGKEGLQPEVDVFLGRKRESTFGIESVSDSLGAEGDISFRDLHFPFRFVSLDGDPMFATVGSAPRYVNLMWRSMKLYNAAIRDFRRDNPLH